MSDVNANIGINFDTSVALAQLRQLQAGLSKFNQTLAQGNLAATNAQKGLNAQLIQSINATGKFVASQKAVATSTLAFTTALEKNQLSLKQYFRYSAAAATANTKVLSRMFANEREIINRARKDRVRALQSQYIQLQKANAGMVQSLQVMPRHLQMINGKFTELATRVQYAAQRQQFLNQLLKQGSTQLLNFGKNMQWAGRQLMVGLTIPLTMLAGYASRAFRDLEKETVKFRRVYGDIFTNDADTNAAVENIKRIGAEYTKFGVAVKDTMAMAAEAAAAGFSGSALDAQVRQANKLAVLGQIEQQQALETTISLQNAFGISSDQLAKKIDFLNAVENQTVVSLDDITTAIPKVAPVIRQLGGSVEDLAFFMTAMKEGGINASEGANALKSGLASLINPTKKASDMLATMGINIKGIVEANAGDLKGTVVGFARALDTLDPLNRARAIEQLFGKFQFARLSTLFQNVTKDGSQASRTLQLAGASVEELAILSEREMKKVEDATGTKFQAALEKFKTQIMPLGKAFLEALTPVVKFFGKIFEKFNSFSDGTKKAITIVTAVLAGIGPIALMTFGLLANGLANIIKLFALLRGGVAKLNGSNSVLGASFDYLTQQELENAAQSNALHTSHQRLIEVFNVEESAVRRLSSAYATAGSQARSLAMSSPGLFAAPGAKVAVSKIPKFEGGTTSVPGPAGAGDVVHSLLSPGEAVIPTDIAQEPSNKAIISSMMSGKKFFKYIDGVGSAGNQSGKFDPIKIDKMTQAQMQEKLSQFAPIEESQLIKKNLLTQLNMEIKQMPISDPVRIAWEKKKYLFAENWDKQLTYDPNKQLFFTGAPGEKGASVDKIRQTLRYQFGLEPKMFQGEAHYVSDAKRGEWSKFKQAITIGGSTKAAGGISTHNPKAKAALDLIEKERAAENARLGRSGELTQFKEALYKIDPSLKGRQLEKLLGLHASHITPGKESGKSLIRDAAKWSKGQVINDFGAMNNYLNTKQRFDKILAWNDKNGNILNLSAQEKTNLKAASSFVKAGNHPVTLEEAKMIRSLAQLELKAHTTLESGNSPKGLSTIINPKTKYAAQAVAALVDIRTGKDNTFYNDLKRYKRIVNLHDATRTDQILVQKGEGYIDHKTGKVVPYTGQNTAAAPAGTVRKGGTQADSRIPKQPGTVLSKPQMIRFGKGSGDYPGVGLSKNAQGRITHQLQIQEQLLRKQNRFSQSEIKDALSRYKKKLVIDEQNKVIQRQQQQAIREEAKLQQQKNANAKVDAREARKNRIMARQEKVGRFSGGASAALGGIAMGAAMTGQDSKVTGGLFAASAIAGMLPMLMNPMAAAATAAIALAGGLLLVNKHAKDVAKEQSKLIDSTTATTEKMKSIGEITGKVGASELYERRRSTGSANLYTTGFERGKQQFGSTFLGSEVGKQMLDSFTKEFAKNGPLAMQKISNELSAYVSDGILTAEQAHSIATQIGINLGNMSISSNISGKLLELLGPNGENLLKDPLGVRINLIQDQKQIASDLQKTINDAAKGNRATGLGDGIFYDLFHTSDWEKSFASLAALNAQNLELVRSQQDSFTQSYDKQIAALKAQQIATTDKQKQLDLQKQIDELEIKKANGVKVFGAQMASILKAQREAYQSTLKDPGAKKQFFTALESQVTEKYKGTAQEALTGSFLTKAKATQSEELEVKIKTLVATEFLDLSSGSQLLDIFKGKDKELQGFLNVAVRKQDPGQVQALIDSLSGIDNKEVQKDILINLISKDPKEFNKYASAIALMEKMAGKEFNITAFFEQKDAMDKLEKLKNKLDEIENIPTPITKSVIANIDVDGNSKTKDMEALLAIWDQWDNLPDETKKTVIQEYVAIISTITPGEVDTAFKKKLASVTNPAARTKMLTDYGTEEGKTAFRNQIAAEKVMQATKQDIASKNASITDQTPSNGNKQDPYEFLLTRLKNVRLAALNAAGGIKEIYKAVGSGKGSIGNAFKGLEQQLMKSGANNQFIDWFTGLDKATQEIFGKVDKTGKLVLTKQGTAMQKAFDKAIVGDFNVAQNRVIKGLKEQETVTKKLQALGLSNTEIQQVLADEAYTTAIATGKVTDEQLKVNNALLREKTIREQISSIIQEGNAAKERQQNLQRVPEVRNFFSNPPAGMPKLTSEAITKMLQDEGKLAGAIKAMDNYKSGAAGAKEKLLEIIDALKTINQNSHIDIMVTGTIGQKAQVGYDAAQKIFDAKRTAYSHMNVSDIIKTKTGSKAYGGLMAKGGALGGVMNPEIANKSLVDVQRARQGLQSQRSVAQARMNQAQLQISQAQANLQKTLSGINDKYDALVKTENDKLKSLQESLKTLFEDKIKVLNTESDKLSNDLAIIDHSTEQINEKYDKQVEALQKINDLNQNLIEQQKQQLDLADAITSGDIAAAARAAQQMRATNAQQYGSTAMDALNQSRQNEIDALTNDKGQTKKEILERQYQISQEIYKLETDPARLKIEQDIEEVQKRIEKLDQDRADALAAAEESAKKLVAAAQAEADAQQLVLDALDTQDAALAEQEAEIQAIIDATMDLEDAAGLTADQWQDLLDKAMSVTEELEGAMIDAMLAVEGSAAATAGSWAEVLASILSIPENVTTTVTEIRKIITIYETQGGGGGGGGGSNTDPAYLALLKLQSGQVLTDAEKKLLNIGGKSAAEIAAEEAAAKAAAEKKAAEDAARKAAEQDDAFWENKIANRYSGGIINPLRFAKGGYPTIGTDTVPAMLTPGEFVMSRYAVGQYGLETMKAINSGQGSLGDSVYNYSINVNVKSDANADDIARAVMTQIKNIDAQKIRGTRI